MCSLVQWFALPTIIKWIDDPRMLLELADDFDVPCRSIIKP
jgi:hypothetical protein